MSELRASMDVVRESFVQVPSLFQLTLSSISNISLWSFSCDDIPESAVPGLLQKIKLTDFDLDLLPNLLPASVQYLDLTGYRTLTEDTLLVIIKKCFSITDLILRDVPLITESLLPRIFWNLPDLRYLSLGPGVGSLSMLEMVQRPIKLLYLEINSASMDEMWLEQLRYFPDLISLRLRNVTIPKIQTFKLPPNLAVVDITTSFQKVSPESLNLFSFFLTNAPNLQEFSCGGDHCFSTTEISSPVVAKDLKVIRAKSRIKVSKEVLDILSDTCQSLAEVSDLLLMTTKTEAETVGKVEFRIVDLETKPQFKFTTKKLNTNYKEITSPAMAWKEGPTEYYQPSGIFVLPWMDPCTTLKSFEMGSGTVDIIEILQLFPNLEVLELPFVNLKLAKMPADVNLVLGAKLKRLDLRCQDMAPGTEDLFAKIPSLTDVAIRVDKILTHEKKLVLLDEVLRKFPYAKKLSLATAGRDNFTLANLTEQKKYETGQIRSVEDHPLTILHLANASTYASRIAYFSIEDIDFNRYKSLQTLKFNGTYLGKDVILPKKLKTLLVQDIRGIYKTTFKIPEMLYCLKWETNYLSDEIVAAIPNMKNLSLAHFDSTLNDRIKKVYGDNFPIQFVNESTLKYLLPRRKEVGKTNFLSAFSGIKPESSTEKLQNLLLSSGSNLSIPELQLIAEMYSRQEISLRSDLPVVHVKIRLTSGAVMNINCNQTHRVIDLYAYARHAVKLGDKAFDLVVPPKQVLDLSTYGKTVQELRLANTTLIQKIRESTPVENELRSFGLLHYKLINFNKTSSAGVPNQEDVPLKKSDSMAVSNNNIPAPRVAEKEVDPPCSDMSEEEHSDLVSDDQMSDEEEEDSMLLSDDDFDMYYTIEKDKKVEEITAENKHLLDQMNAEAMRMSREYHAQQERQEQTEARRKFEAEQRRVEEQRVVQLLQQPVNQAPRGGLHGYLPQFRQQPPQPIQRANPILAANHNNNPAPIMTDEEMARMLQEEEYFQDLL